MSFKENLIRKRRIERLVKTVSVSIGAPGTSKKIDKENMRELLTLGPYTPEKRRDLELYYRDVQEDLKEVLVLDNELPLYGNTTLDDIVLRRSPELKEMISIRNIIKILNDNDILIAKGREALHHVRDRSLEILDLRYGEEDIQEMARDGKDALARDDTESVLEILELFVEVLGYAPLPAEVLVNDYSIYGATFPEMGSDSITGPVVMYNDTTNALKLMTQRMDLRDPGVPDLFPLVASGEMEPEKEGPAVFSFLAEAVLTQKRPTIH